MNLFADESTCSVATMVVSVGGLDPQKTCMSVPGPKVCRGVVVLHDQAGFSTDRITPL